jgi:GNAT superfamily N-acetyltransferase
MQLHSNRTVIHPDYAGMGLGIRLINDTSAIMTARGFEVWAKFSSTPIYMSMSKQACWKLASVERHTKPNLSGRNVHRKTGFRTDTKTYSFRYIPQTSTL